MCGILFRAFRDDPSATIVGDAVVIDSAVRELLERRGPDASGDLVERIGSYTLYLRSTVLHMRGPDAIEQPVRSRSGRFILQWNGEIFGGPFKGLAVLCDTLILVDALDASCAGTSASANTSIEYDPVGEVMAKVEGPFAFLLLDTKSAKAWFARDLFGRRSLLMRAYSGGMELLSVGDGQHEYEELDSSTVYCMDLVSREVGHRPWAAYGRCIPRISGAVDPSQEEPPETVVDQFRQQLADAVKRRLVNVHNSLGVLFSGGVDSLAIAALAHHCLPLDCALLLYNVAFSATLDHDAMPDRQTGLLAYKELLHRCPSRRVEFIRIDVSKAEFVALTTGDRLRQLMAPKKSVMDTSIAAALWFASSSPVEVGGSRVVLLGMGADEQLGGYSRHSAAFARGGYAVLKEELQLDLNRIGSRNMGRDDRIISDHSKEARFPFLDEQFVRYLSNDVPLNCKFNAGGTKLILRLMLKQLGFSSSVYLAKKRAIQFGAQTAKMQKLCDADV